MIIIIILWNSFLKTAWSFSHSVDDVSFSKHEWKSFVDGGSLSQAYTFHVEMYEVDYVARYDKSNKRTHNIPYLSFAPMPYAFVRVRMGVEQKPT